MTPENPNGIRPLSQNFATTMSTARERGNTAFGQGDLAIALASYDEALIADQSDHLSLSNKAYVLQKLGRYKEATDAARKCTEIAPSFAKGHLRLANTLVELMQKRDGPGVTGDLIKEARRALNALSRALRAHELLASARSASSDANFEALIESIEESYKQVSAKKRREIVAQKTKLRADVEAVIALGLQPNEEVLTLMARGFDLGGWDEKSAYTECRRTLDQLALFCTDSASYRDSIEAEHGVESAMPYWIGSKIQALCDTFDYKISCLHGTGTFARRSLKSGEKIIDLVSNDPSMAIPAADGTIACFGQVLIAVINARSLEGPMNDAGPFPNYCLLETAELCDAMTHLKETRAQSAARATVLIENPPHESGVVTDAWVKESTGEKFYDPLNLRMTVTRDVAAGEELTRAYLPQEIVGYALSEAESRHRERGFGPAESSARMRKLRAVAHAVFEMEMAGPFASEDDKAGHEKLLLFILYGRCN